MDISLLWTYFFNSYHIHIQLNKFPGLFLSSLLLQCNSGSWGRGGVFTALSRRSTLPEEAYTLAAEMGDVAVGDCHLIKLDQTR
jgi:hypothetical protein